MAFNAPRNPLTPSIAQGILSQKVQYPVSKHLVATGFLTFSLKV
jgi:hypothetical protein